MKPTFDHTNLRSTIVFGNGHGSELADRMDHPGCKQTLFLAKPHQAGDVMQLSESMGHQSVELFCEAAMHAPVGVTDRALAQYEQSGSDCIDAPQSLKSFGLRETDLDLAAEMALQKTLLEPAQH